MRFPTRTLAVSVVTSLGLATAFAQAPVGPGTRVFRGARVVQADGAIEAATIVVRDGRVVETGPAAAVRPPAGVPVVDLAGKVVVAGFITAHAHVSDIDGLRPRAYTEANTLRQLSVFARYGITTVWSLGGEQAPAFAARDGQGMASLDRARMYLAGPIVTGASPEAARSAVARVAAVKADVVKIRVDDNLGSGTKMPPEVYRAVIEEAHRLGLRVAAHIFYLEDAKALLRAGVDMIAHSVRDVDIDDEFTRMMKARAVPYCPTLTRELATFVYESTPAFFADPLFLREADPALVAQLQEPARQDAMGRSKSAQAYKAALVVAKRNLKRAADAGVLIAMGTDSGAFPERFEGYFEHLEMEMMAEAGLTPAQVLRAATVDAARALRVDDIGRLAPGAWADFVVLDRDPLADIRNTRSISSVWIAGNQVPARADLR
jgi:imidazolonepropionase-like amidohydrolase